MTQDEKTEWLNALTRGRHVEVVLEKNVEYEIGEVQAGGIGVQVVNNGTSSPKAGTSSQRLSGKPESRIVRSTFTYRWIDEQESRIVMLYQYLLQAVKWIDPDTRLDDFCQLFSGRDSDCRVKWIGTQSQLCQLIKVLLDRGYIRRPSAVGQWVIVQSHFVDSHSRMFDNFNRQRTPKKWVDSIGQMAEILNPSVPIDARAFEKTLDEMMQE